MSADPPPSLLSYDPPMLVEGPAAVAALAAKSAKKAVSKGALTALEDIVNSILPPRFVKFVLFNFVGITSHWAFFS